MPGARGLAGLHLDAEGDGARRSMAHSPECDDAKWPTAAGARPGSVEHLDQRLVPTVKLFQSVSARDPYDSLCIETQFGGSRVKNS